MHPNSTIQPLRAALVAVLAMNSGECLEGPNRAV